MRIAAVLSSACLASAAIAPPVFAEQTTEPEAASANAAQPASVVHVHSGRPLRRVKTKAPSPGDDWSFDFDAGASYSTFSGAFPLQDQSSVFADLVASKGGKQFGLHYATDDEFGQTDTTIGVSLAAPVTSRINLSFQSDVSLDRVFNPDYSVRLGGSGVLHYDAKTATYVALSLSSQAEQFRYGSSLSFNPALVIGVSSGVEITAGYTFGDLIDASSAPAAALSQATYTEGWSIGATIKPTTALSLDFLLLPKNTTVLNSSRTTETTFRSALDYAFHQRFKAGLAVEYGATSSPLVGKLYDSMKYEGSIKLSF